MDQLAQSLQQGKTESVEVQRPLEDLNHELSRLGELWATRRQRLEHSLELQRLNQEGDRIEATLSGHRARLKVQADGVRTHSSYKFLVVMKFFTVSPYDLLPQRTKYQDWRFLYFP